MFHKKISFASDNWSAAHPLILQAVIEANEAFSPAYGSDPWTEQAEKLIQDEFKKPCKVFIVPTGTGANVLALKLACRRYESVICTDIAHLNYQETGAAESVVGCKLLLVPHDEGKITQEELIKKIGKEKAFRKHSTVPCLLSITQPTELGTVYSLQEIASISKICQEENLLLHIDGSRFYNAAASLKVGLDEMIESINLDLLSLGGTKNGLMGAESLIIFNPALYEGSEHVHKQTLQLLSKMRYLSAQYIPFFKNKLWLTLATQANQKAQEIASMIRSIPQISLSYPVQTNQIFFTVPITWIPLLLEKVFCYPWNLEKSEIRFIASWNTSEEDITNLKLIFDEIMHHSI